MNEEQKYKIEQYDKHFKEMEDIIKKVKQNEPIIAYLQEILEEEN